jgi:HPt (histidine-containing phosphotransfer) domain-containing protein
LPVPVPSSVPAQSPVARAAPPVDLSVLTDLVGDDAGIVAELLKSFCKHAAQVGAALRQCAHQGSFRAAADEAHKLKSGARSIGARHLADLCAAIEASGPSGGAGRLGVLIAELDTEVDAVLEYIGQWMQSQRSALPADALS